MYNRLFIPQRNSTKQMAIANLLGVAGTDVPIRDIKKLMMPFTVIDKSSI